MRSKRTAALLAIAAALLSGCATYDYYDDGYYDRTTTYYAPTTRYYDPYYDYGYYPRYYAGPSVGLGFSFGRSYWRRH